MPRMGIWDPKGLSFEALTHPGRFLRHRSYVFWIESGSTPLWKKDSTFYIRQAL